MNQSIWSAIILYLFAWIGYLLLPTTLTLIPLILHYASFYLVVRGFAEDMKTAYPILLLSYFLSCFFLDLFVYNQVHSLSLSAGYYVAVNSMHLLVFLWFVRFTYRSKPGFFFLLSILVSINLMLWFAGLNTIFLWFAIPNFLLLFWDGEKNQYFTK